MSLISYINTPTIRDRIAPFRPPPPRKIGVPIQVPSRAKDPRLVGAAFDYVLRFELQRRAPHAIAREWVAEWAGKRRIPPDPERGFLGGWISLSPYRQMVAAVRIVDAAKRAVGRYRTIKSPLKLVRAEMAEHAIRLAKLDSVVRDGAVDPAPHEADPGHVEELLAILAVDSMRPGRTQWMCGTYSRLTHRDCFESLELMRSHFVPDGAGLIDEVSERLRCSDHSQAALEIIQ